MIKEIRPRIHRPSRVTAMTTVAPNLLRHWFARGHVDWEGGPAGGLDTWQAAELAVRAWMSTMGYSPKNSSAIGVAAAPHLIYFAVLESSAALQIHGDSDARRDLMRMNAEDDRVARAISGLSEQDPCPNIFWNEIDTTPQLHPGDVAHDVAQFCIAFRAINLIELSEHFAEAANQPLFDVFV